MRVEWGPEHLAKLRQMDLRTPNYQQQARDRADGIRRTDQAILSSRAQELMGLCQALPVVAAERAERVEALRQAVESGSYRIPEDALVDRLVGVVYPER